MRDASIEHAGARLSRDSRKVEHCPLELPFTPEDQPKVHLKGAHAVHLTGFLEMEDEDELEEGEDMEDATATKQNEKTDYI